MDEYPRLTDGVSITPFDTSSIEPVYLVNFRDGKKFQISKDLYTVLLLLDGKNSVGELAQRLSDQWGREVTGQEVNWIINEKLSPSGIIVDQNGQSNSQDASKPAPGALSLLVKIPLLSEKQLRPITSLGQFLFARPMLILLLILSCIVHIPVYLQLRDIVPSMSLEDVYGYGSRTVLLLTGLSVALHELGHLSACHRYGVRYGKLGFGIYFLSPVAYVDVTDAWRLPRWQRVVVDMGGIYFQLIFIVILYGLYLLNRDPAMLVSIVAINAMFIPNLNPLFKFDGYWALSDAIGVPNLHKRVGDLWRQILPNPDKKQSNAFLQTEAYVRGVMWVYALAVTAYFSYYIWILVWFAPKVVRGYPGLLMEALTRTWQNLLVGDILGAFSSIFQILFPTILLVGLFFLVRRFAHALYKVGVGTVSLVRRWWENARG